MKYLFYVLFFLQILVANEYLEEQEFVEDDGVLLEETELIIQDDEDYTEEVILEKELTSRSLYLNYKSPVATIYKNQKFSITIQALVVGSDFDRIETRFIDAFNMEVLNPEALWTKINDRTYEVKFYFKAVSKKFIPPSFQVILYKNGAAKELSYLPTLKFDFRDIANEDDRFSGVVANVLKINTYKTKQYNNNEIIIILDLEAYNSNLEDFFIKNIKEQGVSSLSDTSEIQTMLYHLVVPIHTKIVEFTYYDLFEKKLILMKIPVVLKKGLVSTQTDLNPNKSDFLFYKKVIIAGLALIFLLLFIWKRKYSLLIISLLLFIVFIVFIIPNKVLYIKNGTVVYILPTKKSTIFFKMTEKKNVEIINTKDNFVKIMFQINGNNIIGWVKNENIIKN